MQGGESGLRAGAGYPADDAAIAVDSHSPGCPVLGFGLVGRAVAVDTGVYFRLPRVIFLTVTNHPIRDRQYILLLDCRPCDVVGPG